MNSFLILNQNWFAEDLRSLGFKVLTCGYSPHLDVRLPLMFMTIEEILTLLPQAFKPDALIYLDDGAPMTIRNIGNFPSQSMFYSVDTHHMAFAHKELGHVFDHIFVAQKDYLSLFPADKSSWLPLWASVIAPGPLLAKRTHKAIFLGTMNPELNPERFKFINALAALAPLTAVQGNLTSYYPYSQIVLNQTVSGDLNFRVFEALGAGALLLTEASGNGLLDLFTPGVDLVTYTRGNVEEAAHLINHFLQHPGQSQEIATRGELKVRNFHQSHHRAKTILQFIQNTSGEERQHQIAERLNNPVRLHGELLQLLVCALSFTFLQREHAREALDNALSLLQKCLSVSPYAPLSPTVTRLACLATFAFDLVFQSGYGEKIRSTLLGKAREYPNISDHDEEDTMSVPTDLESARAIINEEIAKLHRIKPA